MMLRGGRGLSRIKRAAAIQKGWIAYTTLALCALFLWTSSSSILEVFPVMLQVSGDGATIEISADGSTHELALTAPLRSVRFVPLDPYVREYQIDGSDTTNNFNFDPAYFAGIAGAPYYRFQALLRDEGSFSRWENLTIQDESGDVISSYGDPPSSMKIPLPQPFLIAVQLHRLETPASFEFLDENGTVIGITVNRNDKYIRLIETAPGDFPIERARWFYPNDWLPPAAGLLHMLMRAVAVALGCILLLVPVAALLPRRKGKSQEEDETLGTPRTIPGHNAALWARLLFLAPFLASAVVLAAGCFTGVVLFDRTPHILDAVSYYFQGKIMASGSLAAPAPPVKEAFPTPFTVIYDGKWFSQYPPGVPLLLATGFLLGMPWFVQPLLAAAATLLLYDVARRQYGVPTALLAIVLMASSPFLHLISGSFLSHVPAMFFATCFLFSTTRYLENPSRKLLAVVGASLGGILLCREVGVLLYGIPVGGYLLVSIWRHRDNRLWNILPGMISLAIVTSIYLVYNWAQTGNPFLLPRLLNFGGDRFGFGSGVGFYGQHTPAAGLVNTDELLSSLSFFLFGWPFYASLAILVLPFLFGRSSLWDRIHGAVILLTVLAYLGYFYHGIALGPRYYFDVLPSLVLLSARGFSALASTTATMLQAFGFGKDTRLRSRTATVLLCALLMVPNFLYFTPRQVELYRGFTGLPGGRGPTLVDFVRTETSGRKPTLERALVTTTDWWLYAVYLAAMNDPKLDGDSVFALLPYGEDRDILMRAFAGRDWYRLVRDGRDRLVAERVGPIP